MMRPKQSTNVLVACCRVNSKAYVLDPPTGEATGVEFLAPSGLFRGSQISSTEAILGGYADNTSVISLSSGTVTKRMTGGHNGESINCTAHLATEPKVATGGNDHSIAIWDVDAESVIAKLQGIQGHTSYVFSLVNHPLNSEFVFSGSEDQSIKQWDHRQETCVNTFTGHTDSIYGLCYDPTHQLLFSGSNDSTVKGWDHRSGRNVITLDFCGFVKSLLYREESQENQLIVPVQGISNHVIDLRLISENGTTQELRSWRHGHDRIFDICDVLDQNLFVTLGCMDGHARAWGENGECVWDWEGQSGMYGLFSFVNDYEEFSISNKIGSEGED